MHTPGSCVYHVYLYPSSQQSSGRDPNRFPSFPANVDSFIGILYADAEETLYKFSQCGSLKNMLGNMCIACWINKKNENSTTIGSAFFLLLWEADVVLKGREDDH